MRELRAVVIGSGLAGLACAEELSAGGVSVTVLTAGAPGRDGASHRVSHRAPWLLLSAPTSDLDCEAFLADLIERGGGAARLDLTAVLAGEATGAMAEIVRALELCPLDEGPIALPGDRTARGHRFRPAPNGPLLRPLLHRCQRREVRLVPHRWVVGFGIGANRCAEVLAVDTRSGELVAEPADAVVIACGGVGAIFPVATVPVWCRGSGLALAGLAGAALHRPELTQSLPVLERGGYFPSSRTLFEGKILAGGRELPPAADLTELTRSMAEAQRRGERLWLHPPIGGVGLPGGEEAGEHGEVELTVALHHGIGGVAIDPWGRCDRPGLYACGEAAGGVQGRRRTMGTGLLEAWIFGVRAGRAALSDLRDGLGPAPRAEGRLLGPCAPSPTALDAKLSSSLAPLTTVRPPAEVAAVLADCASWLEARSLAPRQGDDAFHGWLEGTRLAAGCSLLAGELHGEADRAAA